MPRSSRRLEAARGLIVVATGAVVLAAACGTAHFRRETLPDGSLRLQCNKPLASCLGVWDSECLDGYDVIRATETRDRKGPYPTVMEFFTSEAVVRCRQAPGLVGGDAPHPDGGAIANGATPPGPAASPAPTEPSAGAPPPRVGCFPGVSQACVGPGGCAGGQTCAADGASFGPCDCGSGRGSHAGPSGPGRS